MEIELRGKKWKQITKKVYESLVMSSGNHQVAFFKDIFYGEITYFWIFKDAECVNSEQSEDKDE